MFWLKIHMILQKLYTLSSLGKFSYLLTNLENHFIPLYKCKISVTPLTNIKWFYLHLHGVFLFLTSLKICCWKLLVFLQSPETQQIFPKYLGWQKSQNKTESSVYYCEELNFYINSFHSLLMQFLKKYVTVFVILIILKEASNQVFI